MMWPAVLRTDPGPLAAWQPPQCAAGTETTKELPDPPALGVTHRGPPVGLGTLVARSSPHGGG